MPVLSKESRDIEATKECRFTLKCACYVIKAHIQMPHTDKYSPKLYHLASFAK